MAYLKNKHLANIKKWNLDLSKYNGGVYNDVLRVPHDLEEFRGFKELFGFEIKEVKGSLFFWNCTSLTSISNLPEIVGGHLTFAECNSLTSIPDLPEYVEGNLDFEVCTSLTSVSNFPDYVGGYLNFYKCTSLTSIGKMPSVVKGGIYTGKCPFFEGMNEAQIREKYGIRKK